MECFGPPAISCVGFCAENVFVLLVVSLLKHVTCLLVCGEVFFLFFSRRSFTCINFGFIAIKPSGSPCRVALLIDIPLLLFDQTNQEASNHAFKTQKPSATTLWMEKKERLEVVNKFTGWST